MKDVLLSAAVTPCAGAVQAGVHPTGRGAYPQTGPSVPGVQRPWDRGFLTATGREYADAAVTAAGCKIDVIEDSDGAGGMMLPEAVSLGTSWRF